MAVYTKVCEADLKRYLSGYDLGTLVTYQGIAEGIENSNYLIRTDKGRYILTLFEKRTNPADLPYFMALKTHLAGHGFACPKPFADKHGVVVGSLAGRHSVIVSFLEGASTLRPSAQNARDFGGTIATMHQALSGFNMDRANTLTHAHWVDMWFALRPKCADLFPDLVPLVDAAEEKLTSWETVTSALPMGTIHADLFLDNVFFHNNACSGFIDFYFACTDVLAYDLAIALNAWAFDERPKNAIVYQADVGGGILQAYSKTRTLSDAEKAAFPMLMQGAALRFFLTRLADWGASPEGAVVNEKDPLPFAQRLAFALGTKSVQDYGL